MSVTDESSKLQSKPNDTQLEKTKIEATPLTLEILKLIKDLQQQHGLRHKDYQRYRGYCSRRINRLRKVLKIPQGDRKHYKKRDVTEAHITNIKADERYLHIPLMMAERCWAYAMQLRQEANTEQRKKFHLIHKLRKACNYAFKLNELCKNDRCDARTRLEAEAYLSWINAALEFELQLWLKATENLKKAQMIYEKLASTLPEEEQLPYTQRLEEEIAPSLRYCAYNVGNDKAVNLLELRSQGVLENLEALVLQAKEKTAAVLHNVKWFGLTIPVRIERVQLFLHSIEGLDDSLKNAENSQAKIKLLENLLIDLRDVITLTRESVNKEKNDQLLLTYLLSIRIERTSQRNLLLIKQSRKPQDCVRLIDINIQQTTEFSQNESIAGNQTAQAYFDEHLKAYNTLRFYYVAKTHATAKRWKEGAILFDKSGNVLGTIKKRATFNQDLSDFLKTIKENYLVDIGVCKAQYVLHKSEEEALQLPAIPQKTYKPKKPLIERLDEFGEEPQLLTKNPNLITIPPSMEAIPAKPIFYDLALNMLEMPDLSEKLDSPVKAKQQAGVSGISGFVKRLWGWDSKK